MAVSDGIGFNYSSIKSYYKILPIGKIGKREAAKIKKEILDYCHKNPTSNYDCMPVKVIGYAYNSRQNTKKNKLLLNRPASGGSIIDVEISDHIVQNNKGILDLEGFIVETNGPGDKYKALILSPTPIFDGFLKEKHMCGIGDWRNNKKTIESDTNTFYRILK